MTLAEVRAWEVFAVSVATKFLVFFALIIVMTGLHVLVIQDEARRASTRMSHVAVDTHLFTSPIVFLIALVHIFARLLFTVESQAFRAQTVGVTWHVDTFVRTAVPPSFAFVDVIA